MATLRPRDSQYSKFFSVLEQVQPASPEFATDFSVKAFFGRVTRSVWWKKRYTDLVSSRVPLAIVTDSNLGCDIQGRLAGLRVTSGLAVDAVIGVRPPASRFDVLHALAHVLTPRDVALHGSEFCKTFAGLVERFMGKQTKDNLLLLYRAAGVKWRTWSPEAKEAARQRAAEKGTPFGNAKIEAAREGVISILQDLTRGLAHEVNDPEGDR